MLNRTAVTAAVGAALLAVTALLAQGQPPAGNAVSYVLAHPDGHPQIDAYSCANFSQEVVEICPHAFRIAIRIAPTLPKPPDPYPVREVPETVQPFLAASPRIQADHDEVARRAAEILRGVPEPRTEADVVGAVLRWTSANMTHAYPNEVPDAVTCLKRGTGNCIGFTHAAAALLRHLGVPVRTVRTLHACPECGKGTRLPQAETQAYKADGVQEIFFPGPSTGYTHMLRHSVIEVYYPESGTWAMYDPQTASVPTPLNIVLGQHVDWDVETQRDAQRISKDKKTSLKVLSPGEDGSHSHAGGG